MPTEKDFTQLGDQIRDLYDAQYGLPVKPRFTGSNCQDALADLLGRVRLATVQLPPQNWEIGLSLLKQSFEQIKAAIAQSSWERAVLSVATGGPVRKRKLCLRAERG